MSTDPANHEELVSRAVDGDTEALGELLAIHRSRLKRMARLRLDPRLASRVSPSDVIQDVGLEAVRRFQEYAASPEVPLFVWLRFLTHQRVNALARHHLGVEARGSRIRAKPLSTVVSETATDTPCHAAIPASTSRSRVTNRLLVMMPTGFLNSSKISRHFRVSPNCRSAGW